MEIKIRRGLSADIPVLSEGEPGFTTDSKKLFIGTGVENVEIAGDQTYTHSQDVPAMEWVVQLPEWFKKYPSVVITDSTNTVVNGQVNINYPIVTLTFTAGFSGMAHFN